MGQQWAIKYRFVTIGSMVQLLFVSVDLRGRVARNPVQDEGGKAPLQEDGAPGHQMGDGLPLLLPSVSGKGTAKFPDLLCCHRMPTTKRLCHHWDESDSLLVALLSCTRHLPVIGDVQGVASIRKYYCRSTLAKHCLQHLYLNTNCFQTRSEMCKFKTLPTHQFNMWQIQELLAWLKNNQGPSLGHVLSQSQ